jgi:lipopolysaccharide cholinephosphotransferase
MYALRDAQRANTELLVEVDRICRAHGLTYFMDSGTLLGAVRHQGSIPWDDDIDISMFRDDYERFAHIAPEVLRPGFTFVTPQDYGESAFYDFIPHIALGRSRIRPDDDDEMRYYRGHLNHILLDIFIIDEAAPTDRQRKGQIRNLKMIYGLGWGRRYHIDYSVYSAVQRPAVGLLSRLGRSWPQCELDRRYLKESTRYQGRGSGSVFMSNTVLSSLDCIFERDWFSQTVLLPYEGFEFSAPVGYREVLTEYYGDYLQLPPEEERRPLHFDAGNPYFKL